MCRRRSPRSPPRASIADDGGTQLDLDAFIADAAGAPAIISFAPWSLPAPGRSLAGIEIDVEVSYGDAAADVPEPLRQAVRLLVAHWYGNCGLIATGGTVALLPGSVAALLAPYRVLAL